MAVVLVVLAAGCSSDESVGSLENLGTGEEQAANRLGELEAPPEDPAATPAPTAPPAAAVATPKPQQAQPTPAPAARTYEIKIVAGGQGFDPFAVAVSRGTRIKVTNTTDRAATFSSDPPGAFDSGPIAPGASWEYVANTPGKFQFHDKERPFAQGQLEVRAE